MNEDIKVEQEPTEAQITEKQIEAAAEALATHDHRLWVVMGDRDRVQYREFARAALLAAKEVTE